jgi:hypothetical protein
MTSHPDLKATLRRAGLLRAARLGRLLLTAGGRARLQGETRRLRTLRAKLGDGLSQVPTPPRRRVLVVGLSGVAEVVFQSPLITAFRKVGYEPIVVLDSRDALTQSAYRAIGVRRFAFHEDSVLAATQSPPLPDGARAENLLQLSHGGIAVGRYAVSRLMRSLRDGDPDVSGIHAEEARAAMHEARRYAESARRMVAQHQPDAALFLDHGYSPDGQLFDAILESGAPCFTWNAAHRDGALVLKRYTPDNRDVHPSSLSAQSWQRLKTMRWNESHWMRVKTEIEDCYRSGQWFAEVGTQVNKRFPSPQDVKRELGLDPAKRTAVIFPHIFWDATFFWGTDLFRNYEAWFVETLKAACANDRLNWIVKVHPGNTVKDRRDGYKGEHSEIAAIRKAVGSVPPHVRVIGAEADIGTLSLYDVLDVCLTVRGTVGIEAAAFGKRVLTAGTGRYDRLGFTDDSETPAEYLARLSRIESVAPPDAARIELARRYAYGVFVARPTPLESIRFAYRHDATGSLDVTETVDGRAMWVARDIGAVADWIESGAEDFLRRDVLDLPEPAHAAAV